MSAPDGDARAQLAMDWAPKPQQTEQERELERVRGKIAPLVVAWCRDHINRIFVGSDLADHIRRQVGGSASSPDRILRDLRKRGIVSYQNVSRTGSKYLVTAVRE